MAKILLILALVIPFWHGHHRAPAADNSGPIAYWCTPEDCNG